jgi:uncharacterized protein YbaA (DUF1428 family)
MEPGFYNLRILNMAKATYVDGFVFCVPKAKNAVYKKLAAEAQKAWMKFGALDYKECMIEEANPFKMAHTFNTIAKPKAGEAVWFSFVTYKSKADRAAVNKKVMAYFEKKYPDMDKKMPFDVKRMAVAGFKVVVG